MSTSRTTALDRECDQCLTRRATWALAVLGLCFSAISARLYYLQMMQHAKVAAKIEITRLKHEVISAPRGAIMDTHGRLLTHDESMQSVVFDNMALRESGPKDKDTGKPKSLGALDRMAHALEKSEVIPWQQIKATWTEVEMQQRFLWWMASLLAPALDKTPEEISIKDASHEDAQYPSHSLHYRALAVFSPLSSMNWWIENAG